VNQEAGGRGQTIGGVGLPLDRSKLLFWFQLGAAAYAAYFYFTVKVQTVEVFLALGLLAFLCLLPSYLWCAGKAHGLPIMPVFALGMFPAYILPIQTDSQVLAGYDAELQLKALLSACGLIVVMTGIWHQLCNRAFSGPPRCRLMDLSKATWLLVTFMVLGLLFQVAGLLFFKYGGGAFAMVRGYTGNGATLALFAFSFQLGQGKLSPPLRIFLFVIVGAQIVVDSVSFILAGTLVKLGILLAGYTLGSQKIPWKSALAALSVLVVLHAGKADMRQAYWREGQQGSVSFGVMDYPGIMAEWVQAGFQTLATGRTREDQDQAAAAERAAMVPVFLRVLSLTPEKVPFLQGETYRTIPSLLVPRVLNEKKGFAHIGNWILAYVYGYLQVEELSKTSIGFDLMIEAYANYGFPGILGLGVALGLFFGWVGSLSQGVPLLSFRFLLAVAVLSGTLGSNNTGGVFVTTIWQSVLALTTFSLLLMKTVPNPLYVRAGAGRKMGAQSEREREGEGEREGEREGGPTSLQASPTREELRRVESEAAQVRHERPRRFVYGGKK
jgi:hypothetical protein